MLDAPEGLATEYYLSNVINKMIGAGTTFAALAAERHALCGTPAALESFMEEVAAGRALNKVKRRFCFALDSVLVTEPAVEGDYSTVLPIAKNVQLVRELKGNKYNFQQFSADHLRTWLRSGYSSLFCSALPNLCDIEQTKSASIFASLCRARGRTFVSAATGPTASTTAWWI